MGFRLAVLGILIFGLFGYLLTGLYRLQIQNGDLYAARAANQIALAGLLKSSRGSIYITDKDGEHIPVALNRAYPAIIAAPAEIANPDEVMDTFADFLKIDRVKLSELLSKKGDLYEIVKSRVTEEEVQSVRQVGFKGIYIDEQESRFYPFNELGAHLIGFLGPDDAGGFSGKYGIEAMYEDALKGVEGRAEKDQYARPVLGQDIFLTIDRNIQERAEEILGTLVTTYGAKGGTVIVEEPKTGKILAFGNYPTFNPNTYNNFPLSRFLNPAVQAIYEPGSILKVVTMSAGIDSGAITPQTTYVDYGEARVKDRVIKNFDGKTYGLSTMTEVIEHSINTGAVFAEKATGHETFYSYLTQFGFGEKTGVGLPGELKGSLKPLASSPKSDVQYATASFGQGISVTPIQLLQAVAAIANNGVLMKPILLVEDAPTVVRRVVSETTAKQVTDMMISAVEEGKIAGIPEYRIAGKTGTAQVPDFARGGYSKDVVNTYIGFGPASNPRFIILIKIDQPEGALLAGQTVVPAFRELAQFILNYHNIPPDDL